MRHILAHLIAALAIAGGVALTPAMAQGLMVKPTLIDATVPPGVTARIDVEVLNTTDEPQIIDVSIAGLNQTSDGGWQPLDVPTAEATMGEESAVGWLSLETTELAIEAGDTAIVPVFVEVPREAKGYYFASVFAEVRAPEADQGITLSIRFVIPLILQIEGRPVRQDVDIADVRLEQVEPTESDPGTTLGVLEVINKGRTYSKIDGRLDVDLNVDGVWRAVTRQQLSQRGIIPGMTLALDADLRRHLPSGTYRVRAELTVDGHLVPSLEKEIEFVGDPASEAAFDTALLLDPPLVTLDVSPGTTRTATVSVTNPGDEPIEVEITAETPVGLRGVAMGDVLGDSLSAGQWMSIRPSKFTLRPGRRQNVRVISQIPKGDLEWPHYYADLLLKGVYADGQSAGTTNSTIELVYAGVELVVDGIVDELELAETDVPGQYLVQCRVLNSGSIHVNPSVKVSVLSEDDEELISKDLTAEGGLLLPLGVRTFSGEIDYNQLAPGSYELRSEFMVGDVVAAVKKSVLRVEKVEVGSPPKLTAVVMLAQPGDAADSVDSSPEGDQ